MTKKFLTLLLITASLLVGNQFARAADPAHPDQPIVPPAEAMSSSKKAMAVMLRQSAALGHDEHTSHQQYENRRLPG